MLTTHTLKCTHMSQYWALCSVSFGNGSSVFKRAGRQNKYPSPLLCRSLPSFLLPDSFTPACLSIPHRIPFPSMLPLCNFNFYHLSSPSSIFLSISLFLMPSLCPVHTLTRLSASLDTHHSPCLLFPLTAFVVGRKSDFSPPPLSLHLLNSPTPAPPLLPARLHPFTPPLHQRPSQPLVHAHTFHRRKGQRVQLPQ